MAPNANSANSGVAHPHLHICQIRTCVVFAQLLCPYRVGWLHVASGSYKPVNKPLIALYVLEHKPEWAFRPHSHERTKTYVHARNMFGHTGMRRCPMHPYADSPIYVNWNTAAARIQLLLPFWQPFRWTALNSDSVLSAQCSGILTWPAVGPYVIQTWQQKR